MTTSPARRHFLRSLSAVAGSAGLPARSLPWVGQLAGLAALASQTSQAADLSGGYRALVCVFLQGGSDHQNWVVPIDASGFRDYTAARGELAWSADRLQAISSSGQGAGRAFGMPQELAPLRKWYEAGQAAIVANVGPLIRPLTVAEAKAGIGLPSKLFSHNDQASTWQSLSPEGARSGWGGRMGDILMAANAYPVFTTVSASGNAVFLSGATVNQYQVGLDGPTVPTALQTTQLFGSGTATGSINRLLNASNNDSIQGEYTRVLQRGLTASTVLKSSLASANVPAIPATPITLGNGLKITLDNDSLTRQLRMVARMIAAAQTLGIRRQVFMVSMSGFDTHANQMRDQPAHMMQVAHALDYFLSAISSLGLANNVTTFTASDFGRTLLSNGDGSDHGWGNHHFVAGGAVRGRNIYGRFPVTALGTGDDMGSGRLLPTSSVSQMAAPLCRWMGLTAYEIGDVLPGIANFDAQALGFI